MGLGQSGANKCGEVVKGSGRGGEAVGPGTSYPEGSTPGSPSTPPHWPPPPPPLPGSPRSPGAGASTRPNGARPPEPRGSSASTRQFAFFFFFFIRMQFSACFKDIRRAFD